MMMIDNFQALEFLSQGEVISIPTESVYGLSVDARNSAAVERLLKLKNRESAQGFILIIGSLDWLDSCEVLKNWIAPVSFQHRQILERHWPGPVTFLFPASPQAPAYLTGTHLSLALRASAHPVLKNIVKDFGHPLVSTSANPHGQPPAKTPADLKKYFSKNLPIVEGGLGDLKKPTNIIDLVTGKKIR